MVPTVGMLSSNAKLAARCSASLLNLPWNAGKEWQRALSPESRCYAAELETHQHRHNKFEQLPHTQKAGIAKLPQLILSVPVPWPE